MLTSTNSIKSTDLSIIHTEQLNLSHPHKNELKNRQFISAPITSLLAQMPAYVDWKNTDSTYLGCSEHTAVKLAGLSSSQEIIGRLDTDLAWGENATQDDYNTSFLQPDKQVLNGNIVISLGKIPRSFPRDNRTVLIKKYPYLNDDRDILGIVSYLIDITNNSLNNTLTQIKALGVSLTPSIIIAANKYIANQSLQELSLSKREEECLYYLLRNNTAKDIAKILDISHRTVETYLNNLKDKFNCINKTTLIINATELGAINLIPDKILIEKYLNNTYIDT